MDAAIIWTKIWFYPNFNFDENILTRKLLLQRRDVQNGQNDDNDDNDEYIFSRQTFAA